MIHTIEQMIEFFGSAEQAEQAIKCSPGTVEKWQESGLVDLPNTRWEVIVNNAFFKERARRKRNLPKDASTHHSAPVGRPRQIEQPMPFGATIEYHEYKYLERIGDGNRTQGLRTLIKWAMDARL